MKKTLVFTLLLTAAAASMAQNAPAPAAAPAPGQSATQDGAEKAPRGRHHARPDAKQIAERHVAALDTDKDGKISRQEYLARQSEAFSKADANGDGFLTTEEMTAQREKRRTEAAARHEARRAGRADAAPETQKPAAPSPAK